MNEENKWEDRFDEKFGNNVLEQLGFNDYQIISDDVISFIREVEQSAYDKAIEAVRVLIKEDMVGIKNGQYISVEDAEIGEYNQALYVAISEINKLKTNERTNTTN